MYPDRPLQLMLYCTKAPKMNTQSTGINLVIDGNVEFYVVLKDNSTKFLFALAAVSVQFNIYFWLLHLYRYR